MSGRSFADFTFKQKLRVGFCGDSYRALDGNGVEVRITVIDADLASDRDFVAALGKFGEPLSTLGHENLVTTRQIGRASDGSLVVVSDAVPGRLDVAELLADTGGSSLPQDIASAIGYHLIHGLATMHGANVLHGAIHPRCVVIDVDGTVKLSELAIGRALAEAGARNPGSPLFAELGGHRAPEARRGGKGPSKLGDVYSAAAVVFHMLAGALPPGTLDISPGFERMIQRALDPDVSRRYSSGTELFENFAEALEDDNWLRASPGELATHVMEAQSRISGDVDQPSGAAALDEATEDLLSILEPSPGKAPGDAGRSPGLPSARPVSIAMFGSTPGAQAGFGSGQVSGSIRLGSDGGEFAAPPDTLDSGPRLRTGSSPFSASRRDSSDGGALSERGDSAGDSMEFGESSVESELDPPTRVDALPTGEPQDPISELIALTGTETPRDKTPLPTLTTSPASRRAPAAIPSSTSGSAVPRPRGDTDDLLDSLSQKIKTEIGADRGADLGDRNRRPPPAYAPPTRPESIDDPLDSLPPLAESPMPIGDPRPVAQRPGLALPAPRSPATPAAVPVVVPVDDHEEIASDFDIISDEPAAAPAPGDPGIAAPAMSAPEIDPPAVHAVAPPAGDIDDHGEVPGDPDPGGEAAEIAAETPAETATGVPRRAAANPEVDPAVEMAELSLRPSGGPLRSMLWIVAALATVGVLVWVVMGQSEMRDAARERAERQEAENQAAMEAARKAQPKPGTLILSSQPGDAAVWMKLGRTPVDTSTLPTDMPHELRLELDGYKTEDIRVVAMHWKGEGMGKRAELQVGLEAGKDKKPVPAYPPAEPPSAREGLSEGGGVIHVESSPKGAQVWLLVGYTTPKAQYTGAEVDRAYEFKVLRDGFLPGFIEIKAHDWKKSVDPTKLSRSVELAPRGRKNR